MAKINYVESKHGLKCIISEVRDGMTFLTYVYPNIHMTEIPIDDLGFAFSITQTKNNIAVISLTDTTQPRRDISLCLRDIKKVFKVEELTETSSVLFCDDSALEEEHVDNLFIYTEHTVEPLYELTEIHPDSILGD